MRGRPARALILAALLAGACAGPPPWQVPQGEVYLSPVASAGLPPGEQRRLEQAWRKIQVGRGADAEKDLLELRGVQGAPAVEAALGYARLAAGRADEALASFQAALEQRPDDASALAGAGSAAFRRGDLEGSLGFFRKALATAPSAPALATRVAELKVQVVERKLEQARQAEAAGRPDDAIARYREALEVAPEVAGMRVALAEQYIARDDLREAARVLEADRLSEPTVLLKLGEVLSRLEDHAGALDAFNKVLTRDPGNVDAQRGARAAQEAIEFLEMPPEYRAIRSAARITRADLAALLAVKVPYLGRLQRASPPVAVDIGGSWAREHILKVLSLGLLQVYSNHTFQPAATVRRGDLAQAVAQVLDKAAIEVKAGTPPSDLTRSNLLYYPATRVVAAGLMDVTPQGAFEPWRTISGAEAIRVLERLGRMGR